MSGGINRIVEEDCLGLLNRLNLEPLRHSSVLLTGSNGLIGSYIAHVVYFANRQLGLDCKLYCVSLHEPTSAIQRLLSDEMIVPIRADLSEPFDFAHNADFIFHAAGYAQPRKWLRDKLKTIALNVDAVHSMLDIARENQAKFMFFSSLGVYGDIPAELVPVPESYNGNCPTTGPRAVYCEAKRLGETICSIYQSDYGVKAYIVRLGDVYGPGVSIHDERVLGDFIRMGLSGGSVNLLDQGRSEKTFGYVSDITLMLFKVMLEGESFIYNVGGLDLVSIRGLAEQVAKSCGDVPVVVPSEKTDLEYIGMDPSRVGVDVAKYLQELGNVEFVGLEEGIQRTVDWNREEFGV